MLDQRPVSVRRRARVVPTGDGASAFLPAIDLRAASAAEPRWCDCGKRIARGEPLTVASRVGDNAGVFDVLWCSVACRASRLGRAA